MLQKSKPKNSDAAPKRLTQYAVFSIQYFGLYSLHTSTQKPFEQLQLSEKLWRTSPNLSTAIIHKMVEKGKKWHNTKTVHKTTSLFSQWKKENYFGSHIQQNWSLSNYHKCHASKNQTEKQWHDTPVIHTTTPFLKLVKCDDWSRTHRKHNWRLSHHHKSQSNYEKHQVVF